MCKIEICHSLHSVSHMNLSFVLHGVEDLYSTSIVGDQRLFGGEESEVNCRIEGYKRLKTWSISGCVINGR